MAFESVMKGEAMLLRRGMTSALLSGAFSILFIASAHADLRVCNKTSSRVGIAIGYKAVAQDWTTEGWWTLEASSCATLLPGPLVSRYYYMYAIDYDQGGEWGGDSFLCVHDKEFTIVGVSDCVARGFQRTGFYEVDTEDQPTWTIQLTEPTSRGIGGQ
jgi:uncharacterized membrane protein